MIPDAHFLPSFGGVASRNPNPEYTLGILRAYKAFGVKGK